MNREKHLETILVISLGLLVVYYVTENRYLIPAIVMIASAGLLSDTLAEKIHWAWMSLAKAIGFVMSKVVLTIVFFLFLFPLALLARLFSKNDPLQLRKKTGHSYYMIRNHQYVAEDLEEMW